jgi:peptidoglycan/LPS O-acetylase OafA/YrhL
MRTARNIAIILAAAAVVDLAPGGGAAADTALTALTMGFLWGMGFLGYRLYRENQMTLATLNETRHAVLLGSLGLIVLLIAGQSKMFATGGGTLAWILLLGLAIFAIVRVWVDANRYA